MNSLVRFDPEIGFYPVLSLWAIVDLGIMAMKEYSGFPKVSALLEPKHKIISCHIQDTRW